MATLKKCRNCGSDSEEDYCSTTCYLDAKNRIDVIAKDHVEILKSGIETGEKLGYEKALEDAARIAFEHCQCSVHNGAWITYGNCKAVKEIRALKDRVA